jgi:hypothetical protein
MGEPQGPSDAQLISTAARLNKPFHQSSPGPRTGRPRTAASAYGHQIGSATGELVKSLKIFVTIA